MKLFLWAVRVCRGRAGGTREGGKGAGTRDARSKPAYLEHALLCALVRRCTRDSEGNQCHVARAPLFTTANAAGSATAVVIQRRQSHSPVQGCRSARDAAAVPTTAAASMMIWQLSRTTGCCQVSHGLVAPARLLSCAALADVLSDADGGEGYCGTQGVRRQISIGPGAGPPLHNSRPRFRH